jgi:hypothetical protein
VIAAVYSSQSQHAKALSIYPAAQGICRALDTSARREQCSHRPRLDVETLKTANPLPKGAERALKTTRRQYRVVGIKRSLGDSVKPI